MKLSNDNPKFAIMNCADRPCGGLVAEWIPEIGYCYNPQAIPGFEHRKQFNGMTPPHPAAIEDFGFEVTEYADYYDFHKVRESVATYYDGKPREWQGETSFTLPKLVNVTKARRMA